MSMATSLSKLDDQKPGVNIQTDGHTLTPTSSQNGPEDPEAFGNTPSCSPSQSPARKLTPNWPEIQYCLEIQVMLIKDGRATSPPQTCLAGTNHGRHGLRWQIWPNRSHSNRPRQGHPVLWAAIIRRRTEPG